MTHQIRKEYHFSAAHMLIGHPKCGRLHGHNYKIEVTVEGPLTGPYNWIVDFGELDDLVKPLIKDLDHRFILTRAQEVNGPKSLWHSENAAIEQIAMIDAPTSSAESLAEWFAQEIPKIAAGFAIYVKKVVVWETPKACGIWEREETIR